MFGIRARERVVSGLSCGSRGLGPTRLPWGLRRLRESTRRVAGTVRESQRSFAAVGFGHWIGIEITRGDEWSGNTGSRRRAAAVGAAGQAKQSHPGSWRRLRDARQGTKRRITGVGFGRQTDILEREFDGLRGR